MIKIRAAALYLFIALAFIATPIKVEAAAPKLYAVNFYADWCGNCKILDPEFTKAVEQGGWSDAQLKVIKLDLTDRVRIGQSIEQAKELGLYPVLKANGAKTGSIAIVDTQSGEELTRFYVGDKADDIQKTIAQKLMQ